MLTASQAIYHAAGEPSVGACELGTCRACGVESVGSPFSSWVKDTFTDHDKLRPGSIICRACLFCFEDKCEALRLRLNKAKPQKMRNYSHFVSDGKWAPLSKGDKGRMLELLRVNPTVAIITDSGQKHIIFRARSGFWQFEEQNLRPCAELLESLLSAIAPLYQGGASKAEIESGLYSQKSIRSIGIHTFQECEAKLKPHRGSLPMRLALFLAQKENDGASTDSGRPTDAAMDRHPGRLQAPLFT